MSPFPPPGSATDAPVDTGIDTTSDAAATGRETGDVSELPPPPPPPPSPDARPTGAEWDWDRVRNIAENWFRPLAESRGWLALAYLSGSAVAAPLLFGVMVGLGALTFALILIVVGVFLVVPFFAVVNQFTAVERWLASLAGHHIEPRPPRPIDGAGPRSALRAISDPVRWRNAAFLAANVLVAPFLLAIGGFPFSVALQAIFGSDVISGPGFSFGIGATGLLALPVLAVALGAIPRVAIWMAGVKAEVDGWFLGTDRLAAAEARVSTLSTQRHDILDAVASERRRIERNLHDGVQQQLVAIGLDLGMAESQLDRDPERVRELIGSAREKVQGSIGELRQLGRGLHPAILADRGIDAALSAVVSGSPIPISVLVDPDLELSTDVAETVYFIANEAIANVLKHAEARVASVHVAKVGANVRVTVHDDGHGGADPSRGTGLAGIRARVNAADGVLMITSPGGGPTTLVAEFGRRD